MNSVDQFMASSLMGKKLTIASRDLFSSAYELRWETETLATFHPRFRLFGPAGWIEDESGARWDIDKGKGFLLRPGAKATDSGTGDAIAEFVVSEPTLEFTGRGAYTLKRSGILGTKWTLADPRYRVAMRFTGWHPSSSYSLAFAFIFLMACFAPVALGQNSLFMFLPLAIIILFQFSQLRPYLLAPIRVEIENGADTLPNLPMSTLLIGLALYYHAMPREE